MYPCSVARSVNREASTCARAQHTLRTSSNVGLMDIPSTVGAESNSCVGGTHQHIAIAWHGLLPHHNEFLERLEVLELVLSHDVLLCL